MSSWSAESLQVGKTTIRASTLKAFWARTVRAYLCRTPRTRDCLHLVSHRLGRNSKMSQMHVSWIRSAPNRGMAEGFAKGCSRLRVPPNPQVAPSEVSEASTSLSQYSPANETEKRKVRTPSGCPLQVLRHRKLRWGYWLPHTVDQFLPAQRLPNRDWQACPLA